MTSDGPLCFLPVSPVGATKSFVSMVADTIHSLFFNKTNTTASVEPTSTDVTNATASSVEPKPTNTTASVESFVTFGAPNNQYNFDNETTFADHILTGICPSNDFCPINGTN